MHITQRRARFTVYAIAAAGWMAAMGWQIAGVVWADVHPDHYAALHRVLGWLVISSTVVAGLIAYIGPAVRVFLYGMCAEALARDFDDELSARDE